MKHSFFLRDVFFFIERRVYLREMFMNFFLNEIVFFFFRKKVFFLRREVKGSGKREMMGVLLFVTATTAGTLCNPLPGVNCGGGKDLVPLRCVGHQN